ncbi:MAG TPA: hypothetical protein IAB34_11495 [Candidatus Egerieimonas faecigallinarum]|nr:hypothetical protein [Candidatus Egerieimonas faecigallinarum]
MFWLYAAVLLIGGAVYYAGCARGMQWKHSGVAVLSSLAVILLAIRGIYITVTGFLTGAMLSGDSFKYRGNRLFLLRGITAKLTVIGKTMGILALLLTVTLTATQLGVLFQKYFDAQVQLVSGYDVAAAGKDIGKYDQMREYIDGTYHITYEKEYPLYRAEDSGLYAYCGQNGENTFTPVMRYSDFCELRENLGYEPVQLQSGKYLLLAPDSVKLKEKLSEPPKLSVNGTELSAQACLSEAFNLYGVNGEGYTAVVDDELAAELPQYRTCLVMNTQERLPADTEKLSELAYGADYENYDPETDTYTLNSSIEDAMDSNVIIFAFALFYVGLIFACIAASILAVQRFRALPVPLRGALKARHERGTDRQACGQTDASLFCAASDSPDSGEHPAHTWDEAAASGRACGSGAVRVVCGAVCGYLSADLCSVCTGGVSRI